MRDSTFWVGFDWSVDSMKVSVFSATGSEPVERFEVMPDDRGLTRLVRRLKSYGSGVRCVYEAGPGGYELQRYLAQKRICCEVAAPSLIPQRPGDRVKTDRRDADKLGRFYRAGELTLVPVPDERQESLRDLLRAREDARQDLLRRRHRLSKFLLRRGYRFRVGKAWTKQYWVWLGSIHFDDLHSQIVLEEYVAAVAEGVEQVGRFDRFVEGASRQSQYATKAGRFQALRGVATQTALTILAETGDLRRYAKASQFMSATGLVASEHSSGEKRRQGGITKTGNAHMRRVLVEAAWHYRHWPSISRTLQKRREGQPLPVLAIARKAEIRLHRKYQRLTARGKRSTQAIVAVARELAGFVWAIGQIA